MSIAAFVLSLLTSIHSAFSVYGASLQLRGGEAAIDSAAWMLNLGTADLAVMFAALAGTIGGAMSLARKRFAWIVLLAASALCTLALPGGLLASAIWCIGFAASGALAFADMRTHAGDEGTSERSLAELPSLGAPMSSFRMSADGTHITADERIYPRETLLGIDPKVLVRRAFLFMEDGEFDRADHYLEQALALAPEYSRAYLGKMMVELGIRRENDLAALGTALEENRFFQRAMRFSGEEDGAKLTGFVQAGRREIERKREQETEELDKNYSEAMNALQSVSTLDDMRQLLERFISFGNYKNAEAVRLELTDRISVEERYAKALELWEKARSDDEFEELVEELKALGAYKDCATLIQEVRLEKRYRRALSLRKHARTEDDFEELAALFESLETYRNSAELAADARRTARDRRRNMKHVQARRSGLLRAAVCLTALAAASYFLFMGGAGSAVTYMRGALGLLPETEGAPAPAGAERSSVNLPNDEMLSLNTVSGEEAYGSGGSLPRITDGVWDDNKDSSAQGDMKAAEVQADKESPQSASVKYLGVRHGMTVTLYEAANTGSAVISAIPPEYVFPITEARQDSSSNVWWYRVNGAKYGSGWIRAEDVNLEYDRSTIDDFIRQGEEEFNAARQRIADAAERKIAQGDAGASAASPSEQPMELIISITDAGGEPEKAAAMRITGAKVNLRSSPSTNSAVVSRMSRGDIVNAIETRRGTDGQIWYRVRTSSGDIGWVFGKYAVKQ